MTEELETQQQEIRQYAQRVPAIIQTQEQFIEGAAMVVEVGKELKKRKAWFDMFLAPAKDAKVAAVTSLRAQERIRDAALEPLTAVGQSLRHGLVTFKRAEDERLRREQERQNKLYSQRVARAEKQGTAIDEVKPPVVLPAPQKSIKSDNGGGFTVKTIQRLVIVDPAKIPDQFFTMVRNDTLIEQTLRAGVDVPGAMLEEDSSSVVRTK